MGDAEAALSAAQVFNNRGAMPEKELPGFDGEQTRYQASKEVKFERCRSVIGV